MSKSPQLDASADLARLLLHATRAFEREMLARLARSGLDMLQLRHLPVLRAINAEEGMRAAAIARHAGVSRQAIAQVVAELEQFDIVEQIADPSDGRAKIVRYTPFGRQGYMRAMASFTALEAEARTRVGSDRIETLKEDLRKLADFGQP